jgi:hypothetical protein
MSDMPTMEAKTSIRLDRSTEAELTALIKHYTKADPLNRKVTASDVVRIAIHRLYRDAR